MVRDTPKLAHGFMEVGAACLLPPRKGKENDLFFTQKPEGQRLG